MKTIFIRKDKNFSNNSNVQAFSSEQKILTITGFEYHEIILKENNYIFFKHQWTKSKKIHYYDILDNSKYTLSPILNRKLTIIMLPVALICVPLGLAGNRWGGIPLIPFALYIIYHLTLGYNSYIRFNRTN